MVAALQQALTAAGVTMAQIGYRMADISGEQYAFKEADLAVSRILRDRHDFQDLWHPADCIGEVGAASVPGMLAIALIAARKGYAAGNPVLAHCGNDDGRRAAIVLNAGGRA
jgi:3-oxoacyl-[acyl-carrier-protein] synthase-1